MKLPPLRKQDPYKPLAKDEFRARFYARFQDPAFGKAQAELEKVFEIAWDG